MELGSGNATNPEVNPRKGNQYVGAIIASLGGFSLGVSLGWNSSAGDVLRNILLASASDIGLVGGILNAGACCGLLLLPWILRHVNRTETMFITIPINLLGWAFICFAGQQVWLLIIGRMICGLVGGIFCVLTPLYIAEIADKTLRPRLLGCFQLFVNFGVMYAFLVAYVLEEHETIWRYSLVCAVACAPIALVKFLPESPIYYLMIDNANGATQSIKFYRGDKYKYQEELAGFQQLALAMKPSGFKVAMKIIRNRKVLLSLIVCHGVIIGQQLSGVNPMIFYALPIFNNGGSGNITGEELTIVVGAVQISSCLVSMFVIDRCGRRILLTMSATTMGLSLILLGWYFKVRDSDPEFYEDTLGWMPPTWIGLFFVAFNLGIGPISWAMLADTFPMEIRVTAATSAAFLSWLISLIATFTFGEMAISLGIPRTMWLFGAFTWIAAIFFAIFVRDNKGKTLMDIQRNFDAIVEESQVLQET